MTDKEIFEGLKDVLSSIKPRLDLSTVTTNSRLVEDLAIDSLSMLMLALASEKKFSIVFDEHTKFTTVEDIIKYISESLKTAK